MIYSEIISFLKQNASEKDKTQWIKTIKLHENVYGVSLARINPMIPEWKKNATFEDIRKLWKTGKTEARIIAAKLLGKIAKKEPDTCFKLMKEFSRDLEDWATTDTLATQGIRGIIKSKEGEIKSYAIKCLKSKNTFTRRFGIVVFINFPESKEAKQIVEACAKDRNPYIKKAVEWLRRKI